MIKCPLDLCKYNVAGTCTKDDVVLEIADIDEQLECTNYTDKNKEEEE